MTLEDFSDIHTHRRDAGGDAIINLNPDDTIPTEGFFSVGIHPWDSASATDETMARVAAMAQSEQVVAIGETGLDALRGASLETQERIFRRHVELSERLGKPLIIHAVRTFQRLIELRQELHPQQRWVIHGFRGKPQLAESLLRAGFDLSFGKRYNPAAYAITPPSRRFHETDEG